MSAERVKLYKLLVVDAQVDATAALTLNTGVVTLSFTLTPGARRPIKLRMPATARGRYAQVRVTPTGKLRLFGMTLYGRRVGESAEASWTWVAGPVDGTPEEWTEHALPIPPTSDEWIEQGLPIPPTSTEWAEQALPIPPTSEEWAQLAVPIAPSADLPQWAEIPLDR